MAAPTRRTGLGRGIGALIPTSDDPDAPRPVDVFFPDNREPSIELLAVPGARLVSISPSDVVPNPQQPRSEFNREELEELVPMPDGERRIRCNRRGVIGRARLSRRRPVSRVIEGSRIAS